MEAEAVTGYYFLFLSAVEDVEEDRAGTVSCSCCCRQDLICWKEFHKVEYYQATNTEWKKSTNGTSFSCSMLCLVVGTDKHHLSF